MGVSQCAPSVHKRATPARGFRPRTEQRLADSGSNNCVPSVTLITFICSYVQELEARLLHMESLLGNSGIVVDPSTRSDAVPKLSPAVGAAPPTAIPSTAPPRPQSAAGSAPGSPDSDTLSTEDELFEASAPRIKKEEDEENVADQFGQLALDGHGQLRWIGGSSTMSLIEAFHSMSADPGATPPPASKTPRLNVLYFPPSVVPGKMSALPGAEEVEYPERDLADKLVCPLLSWYCKLYDICSP